MGWHGRLFVGARTQSASPVDCSIRGSEELRQSFVNSWFGYRWQSVRLAKILQAGLSSVDWKLRTFERILLNLLGLGPSRGRAHQINKSIVCVQLRGYSTGRRLRIAANEMDDAWLKGCHSARNVRVTIVLHRPGKCGWSCLVIEWGELWCVLYDKIWHWLLFGAREEDLCFFAHSL